MNRGSIESPCPLLRILIASMRPRFMNRGSIESPCPLLRILIASMRPRFMNRGSRGGHSYSQPRTYRFNEAPIHESGKYLLDAWAKSANVPLQ